MTKHILLAITCLLFSLNSFSQNNSIRLHHFNVEDNVAIKGYDPVSYFTENKATKGKKELALVFKGIIYYFSSQENKNAFNTNPNMYEPQYGGWCAYAMGSKGEKVDIDPKTFKLVDGKLFLFYNAYFNNTLKSWNKDEKNLKTKADQNWNNIIK